MNTTQQDIKEFNELYKDLHTVPFSPERDMLVAATHDTLEMVEKYPEISTDPYIRNMFVADILSTEDYAIDDTDRAMNIPMGNRSVGKVLKDLKNDVIDATANSADNVLRWSGSKIAKAIVSTTRWLGVFTKRSATFANNALLSKHAIAKACAKILSTAEKADAKYKVKHGVTYKEIVLRAEKLIDLCKRLSKLVRSQDTDKIGTPEFWNSFIGAAKYCVQVTKPKDGSPFPRIIWVTPKRENMWSLNQSEYSNRDSMARLSKTLQDLHIHGFVNLAEAAKQCRKQCSGISEKIEAGSDKEGSPKLKNFSRCYITSRLFAEVQAIVIKEIRYFTGTVKSELMKLKQDDSKYDKMIGSSSANETDKDDDNDNKESKEMLTDILERAYASLEEMTTAKETSDKLQTYYNEFKPKGEELRGRLYAMLKKLASEDAVTATTKYLKVKCLNNPSDFVTRISERISEQILFNDKVCGYETKQLNHDIAKRACEEHVRALDMVLDIKGISKSISYLKDRKDIKQAVNNYIQVTKHLWYSSRRLLTNIRLHPHANEEDRKEAKEKREVKESLTEAKEALTYEQVIGDNPQIAMPGIMSTHQMSKRLDLSSFFKKKDVRENIREVSNENLKCIDQMFDSYYIALTRELNKPMYKFKGADIDSLTQIVHKLLPTAIASFVQLNPLDSKPIDQALLDICKNTKCIDVEVTSDKNALFKIHTRNIAYKDQILYNSKWFNKNAVQLLHNCLRIVEQEGSKSLIRAYDMVEMYNKSYSNSGGMLSTDQLETIRNNVICYITISQILDKLKFELITLTLKHIYNFTDYMMHH